MRTVFMGTPGFAVPSLEQLLLNKYEVVAVYTQPDRPAGRGRALVSSPVKEAALRWQLPVLQPESLKSAEAISRLADLHHCRSNSPGVSAKGTVTGRLRP